MRHEALPPISVPSAIMHQARLLEQHMCTPAGTL